MFDIILVDDENYSVDTLTEIIDFNRFGFNLAGVFYDAASAIEFVNRNNVNVIITDIKMPRMSGLDFLSVIKSIKPDIEVIFLTAYADFDYAQFAIDHKLYKYMLKPVTITDIEEVLSQLNDLLTKRQQSSNKDSGTHSFKEHISPSAQIMLYEYLYHRSGTATVPTLQGLLDQSDINYDLSTDFCALMNVDFIDIEGYFSKEKQFNYSTLFQSLKNIMCRNDILVCVFLSNYNHVTAYVMSKSPTSAEFNMLLHAFADSIINNAAELLDIQLDISFSRIFTNIAQLAQYNHSSMSAKHDASMLLNAVQNPDVSRTYISNKLNSLLVENSQTMYYKENLAQEIYALMLSSVKLNDFYAFNLYPKSIVLPLKYDDENVPVQIEELIDMLPHTLEHLINYFSNNIHANSNIIQDAISYVQAHYTDNISLNDTAKFVHCNPTYLSRKLKEETGLSFTNYLNMLRIQHSEKLLLNTNLTVNEVANQSGYCSLSYFYRKFKEKHNCSPDIYRNNC